MIIDDETNIQFPSVDDLAPEYMKELQDDVILDRNVITSRRGNVEYLRLGLKGRHPSKAIWMEIGKVRKIYPHLLAE